MLQPSARALRATVVLSLLGASCGGDLEGDLAIGKTEQAWTARKFGVYATKYYENDWVGSLNHMWALTNNFVSNLDDTDTSSFYGGMYAPNQREWYDDDLDGYGYDMTSGGLDTVDLFFNVTHGVSNPPSYASMFYMWDENYYVWTHHMRLGDEGGLCSIFSTMACRSMLMDGNQDDRWWHPFSGGLRIALGAPWDVGAGEQESAVGTAFADYLQAGYAIYSAWYYALRVVSSGNPVAAMATGTNQNNCTSRLYGMTWQNFKTTSYPRLRDGDIGYMCWIYWT